MKWNYNKLGILKIVTKVTVQASSHHSKRPKYDFNMIVAIHPYFQNKGSHFQSCFGKDNMETKNENYNCEFCDFTTNTRVKLEEHYDHCRSLNLMDQLERAVS